MTSARPSVVVFDYGSGNVHSAVKALTCAGADVALTREPDAVRSADGLFVPGVGAFSAVIQQMRKVNGPELIRERIERDAPVLGVCVGLQTLFESGTEHGTTETGLGFFPGEISELPAARLPHMGWNTVQSAQQSTLFQGIEQERFYFVHSFGAPADAEYGQAKVTRAEHLGATFVAAIESGALSATQFHPEKSGEAGLKLLQNWLQSFTNSTGASEHRTV